MKTLNEIESSIIAESSVSENDFLNILSAVVTDSPLAPSISLMNTLLEIESSTDAESDVS